MNKITYPLLSPDSITLVEPAELTPMTALIAMNRRGREPGGKNACGVCGKPETRNSERVNNACPTHKMVADRGIVKLAAQLEYKLSLRGHGEVDFATRKSFNAQLEYYAQAILKARLEHNAYIPPEPDAKAQGNVKAGAPTQIKYVDSAVGAVLRECLALLGAKASAEFDPLKLAGYVKGNIMLLIVEAQKQK